MLVMLNEKLIKKITKKNVYLASTSLLKLIKGKRFIPSNYIKGTFHI